LGKSLHQRIVRLDESLRRELHGSTRGCGRERGPDLSSNEQFRAF
jgi:hypothetical protein